MKKCARKKCRVGNILQEEENFSKQARGEQRRTVCKTCINYDSMIRRRTLMSKRPKKIVFIAEYDKKLHKKLDKLWQINNT